jgi:hypothetical protein
MTAGFPGVDAGAGRRYAVSMAVGITRTLRPSWLPLALTALMATPMAATAGYVRGHVRADGTYVPPHYRNPPGFGSSQTTTSPHASRSTIKRDPEERRAFVRSHPCPSTGQKSGTCPGYVVGYVVPLKHGGPDVPYNMQWQPSGAAKPKDKSG